MPKPKLPHAERSSDVLTIRIRADRKKVYIRHAKRAHQPLSAWVLDQCDREAVRNARKQEVTP